MNSNNLLNTPGDDAKKKRVHGCDKMESHCLQNAAKSFQSHSYLVMK